MTLKIQLNPRSWFNFDPEHWKEDLIEGVGAAFRNSRRATASLFTGFAAFLFTIFSGNPGYSIQMLSAGIQYWPIAFTTRFTGLVMNSGYTGMVLTIVFSALVGVTMTNTVIQLRMNRIDFSSLGALPGFLAGGCASCGVGILSLLGFGGALASLPFAGNSLRLGGVLMLVALIIRTGNPDNCKI